MLYQISYYFLIFITFAFIGWLFESICCCFIQKKLVLNRGFLIGPICPIYGYGALVLTTFLKKYYDDPLALFIMAVVGASILEYVTSYAMEKIFKARWWDYSEKKFNLNGRICLENAIAFGLLGLLLMYLINPIVVTFYEQLNPYFFYVLAFCLFLIYLVDNIITFIIMFELRSNFGILKKDATEEISEQVKEILTKNRVLKVRVLNAFPTMKIKAHPSNIKKFHNLIKGKNKC